MRSTKTNALPHDKYADLTLVYKENGFEHTLKGKVRQVSLDVETDYEDVLSERAIYSPSVYKTAERYTLQFVHDVDGGSGSLVTVSKRPETPFGVKKTVQVEIDKATPRTIAKAREQIGAPEDTEFYVERFTGGYSVVTFEWTEGKFQLDG